MSVDKTFNSETLGFKSHFFKTQEIVKNNQPGHGEITSGRNRLCGITNIDLPWLMDKWHDLNTRARISIQIQILSGKDFYQTVSARVSTDQKCLVLTFPMSAFMSDPQQSVNTYVFGMEEFIDDDEDV